MKGPIIHCIAMLALPAISTAFVWGLRDGVEIGEARTHSCSTFSEGVRESCMSDLSDSFAHVCTSQSSIAFDQCMQEQGP